MTVGNWWGRRLFRRVFPRGERRARHDQSIQQQVARSAGTGSYINHHNAQAIDQSGPNTVVPGDSRSNGGPHQSLQHLARTNSPGPPPATQVVRPTLNGRGVTLQEPSLLDLANAEEASSVDGEVYSDSGSGEIVDGQARPQLLLNADNGWGFGSEIFANDHAEHGSDSSGSDSDIDEQEACEVCSRRVADVSFANCKHSACHCCVKKIWWASIGSREHWPLGIKCPFCRTKVHRVGPPRRQVLFLTWMSANSGEFFRRQLETDLGTITSRRLRAWIAQDRQAKINAISRTVQRYVEKQEMNRMRRVLKLGDMDWMNLLPE